MAKKKKDAAKKAALQQKKEAKAEKAARKRLNKEAKQQQQQQGENDDDIDDLLEAYRKKDLNVETAVLEKIPGFPPPRANATLTLADDKNGYIYLFGGEYYDGVENIVLDDLFRWDPTKNDWRHVITPAPRPAPRCAHSTVYYKNSLYVLAGELATAEQYHHYRDLWRLDLATLKWEEVQTRGTSPSARSGHAAFVWKHYMIVFGGFYEALRDTRWFNDVCVLDLQTNVWLDVPQSKLASQPEPRSACNFCLKGDVAMIHGGFSKLKNPTTKAESKVHSDAWLLHLKPILQGKPPTWERLSSRKTKGTYNPSNRSGTASATYKDRMLVYGGVVDTEQFHHKVDSVFYNELFAFDMERNTWFPLRVKAPRSPKTRRRRRKGDDDEDDREEVEEQVDQEEEEEESDSSDLEEEDGEDPTTSSGWDLDMLRSNMFAFIDGEGNIIYEKIQEEDGYEVDNEAEAPRAKESNDMEEAKGDDTDEDEEEEEAKGDDTDEEEAEKPQEASKVQKAAASSPLTAGGHVLSSSSVMRVDNETGSPEAVAREEPLPRINATVIVRSNVLYVYGGILEVGDREVTLDDCWAFDLKKREKWECLWKGTMHKQVWRGAVHDDDDSYISTEPGGDDDDDDEEESGGEELVDEEARREAKAAKKAAKKEKEKSKRAGLRQEIAELKGKLDLDDSNRTPQMGEALADFYSRTSQYWNDQARAIVAADAAQVSESEKLSSKELKREGFKLASERYDELRPVLERLDELELQQREAEEERKTRKENRKGKKGR